MARAGVEPATFRFSGGRSYQLSYLAVRPAGDRAYPGSADRCDASGRDMNGDPDGT